MRRNRIKKYIVILLALLLISAAALGHIASIVVPVEFQTVLLGEFERATGKKILVKATTFNIFRGLCVEGIVIYDKVQVLARVKKLSAYVVIPEIFNKKVVIPFIKIEGPAINLEREPDGSLNIASLIPKDYKPPRGFGLALRRIVIRHGSLLFTDRKTDPLFKNRLDGFNADIRLRLPSSIIYKCSFNTTDKSKTSFSVDGEYLFDEKRSKISIAVKDISILMMSHYVSIPALASSNGFLDADIILDMSPFKADAHVTARTKSVAVSMGTARANMAAVIRANINRGQADNKWMYAGSIDVSSMDVEGVEGLGSIEKAKGVFRFDQTHLWCDALEASVFGMPWRARLNIANFSAPIVDLYANFEGKLGAFQKTLCESCRFTVPVEFAGDASLEINVTLEKDKPLRMNGYAKLRDVTMRLGSGLYPVEHISGEARFTPQKLEWSDLRLAYRDIPFKTSGAVVNFSSPGVELKAASKEFSFDAVLNMSNTDITLTKFIGRYLNSSFSMKGYLDTKDPSGIVADVKGSLDADLKDLRYAMKNSPGIRKMKPAGRIKAEFALSGNIRRFFDCTFHAKAKTKSLMLYGARLSEVALDYNQSGGLGEVRTFNAKCYGGLVSANGKINWRAKAQPYSFSVKAQDVMLELVKTDTGFKDANVSGDLKAYANLSGYFKDVTRLSGVGRITITDGKLWELNLFKGLGRSIFTSDFSSIVFSEGSCDFKIKDQLFFADSVDLKGDLMELSGAGVIGFDKTIDGILRPEINESAMWPGTQRNIAMAVQRGTAIEITGTLKDPRFRTRTDLLTVVGGVAGALLGSE